MSQTMSAEHRVAIVGGGISGLSAAWEAVKSGVPGNSIDILEGGKRLGGKIESGNGIEYGAEFVDTDQTSLLRLCKELNVNLVDSHLGDEVFRLRSGKVMDADTFYKAIEPLQKKIIQDKQTIAKAPFGERAQQLNNMSLDDYLKSLNGEPQGPMTFMKRVQNFFAPVVRFFKRDRVHPELREMLAGCYTSESGRDPTQVSALQFSYEMSSSLGSLLASDCGLRIEGGTERVITELEKKLKAAGVNIQKQETPDPNQQNLNTNPQVKSVIKQQDDTFLVGREDGKYDYYNNVVLAMPMHELAKLQGLETLGVSPEELATLRAPVQYTHSAKFAVSVNSAAPDISMFSGDGYQAWRKDENTIVFLAGGQELNAQSPKELVQHCLESYAQAHGSTVETLFGGGADTLFKNQRIAYRGPDLKRPCYAAPAPGQVLALQKLSVQTLPRLAKEGVGIVGTYIPDSSGSIGFMSSGVEVTERVISAMKERLISRGIEQSQQAGINTINHAAKLAQKKEAYAGATR